MQTVNNFTVIESVYGKIILDRHCSFQAESLIKTGRTHIEEELSKIFTIIDRLDPGSVIVDGGANAGFFTIPVAQRTRDRNIQIYSFEPQRQMFQALGGSLVLNDLYHVMLYNMALGDQAGTVTLPDINYSQPQDFGTVQVTKSQCDRSMVDPNQAALVRLDDIGLSRLDFLKLDVEGYECAALQGGHDLIQTQRPWIWVEYFITGAAVLQQQLSHLLDYEFVLMDYQNMLCAPKERLSQTGIEILNHSPE